MCWPRISWLWRVGRTRVHASRLDRVGLAMSQLALTCSKCRSSQTSNLALVIVSHDREFLDRVCTRIVETEQVSLAPNNASMFTPTLKWTYDIHPAAAKPLSLFSRASPPHDCSPLQITHELA